MGVDDDGEEGTSLPGNPRLEQSTGSISSLNEAWFHILDRCITHSPMSKIVLPLMRNCFFAGAVHTVLLLQKGHGHQLAADIAGFIMEEPQS